MLTERDSRNTNVNLFPRLLKTLEDVKTEQQQHVKNWLDNLDTENAEIKEMLSKLLEKSISSAKP